MCACGLNRSDQQQATSILHAPLPSKNRRPTLAPGGRPASHIPSHGLTATAATQHAAASGIDRADTARIAEKPAKSSLMSAGRTGAAQNRLLPRELPAPSRPGFPAGRASMGATGREPVTGPASYRATGRPGLRRPTLEPPIEKTSSPSLLRRVAPRVFASWCAKTRFATTFCWI